MALSWKILKPTCMAFAVRGPKSNSLSQLVTRRRIPNNVGKALFSSFNPPEPPASKGVPVYDDIDFSTAQDPSAESMMRNNDPNAVFVVTGGSRGIGFQFVKSLLDRTKGNIVACCRNPQSSVKLQELISSVDSQGSSRITTVSLDLEDQQSIESAVTEIESRFERVDMLLNVAGLLGDGKTTSGPERTIKKLDRTWFEKTLAINVVGPMMFTKEIAPLMFQRRRRAKGKEENARPVAVVANLSARVGSISDNELGGWYSYRISKSALNQATRTMAHEVKRQCVWCVALHPGTTDTDLSKPFQGNVQEGRLFPVEFTVDKLLNILDSLQEKNSGGLYDWAGKALPF